MPVKSKTDKNGGVHISITCDKCGEPITVANEYGMFCKNLCGLNKSRKAAKKLNKLVDGFLRLAGEFEEKKE